MLIKDRITLAMKALSWNASRLAERSDVPQPTIHRICKGEHKDPRSDNIRKLAQAFGCTEGQLRGTEHWPLIDVDAPPPVDSLSSAHHNNLLEPTNHYEAISPRKRAMLELMNDLTEQQQDELIRRAEERAEENKEVIRQLARPAGKKKSA